MAETQLRKIITLNGRIDTPVVVPQPFFKENGCWIRIVKDLATGRKPFKTTVGKLVKGERKPPKIYPAYRGYVKISYVHRSITTLKRMMERYLRKTSIGNLTTEGLGRVTWLHCSINDFQPSKGHKYKKFRIRKGLGPNCPPKLQKLIIALLLHDFVHTERHQSKIYQQINIQDEEIREACLNHHNGEKSENELLPIIKYYDGLAAYISRKEECETISRYDHVNGNIDFEKLAKEIEAMQKSAYKLYQYVYHSKELERIVESMFYGEKSLRNHILLMANLAINNFYNEKIIIKDEKIDLLINHKQSLNNGDKNTKTYTKVAEMQPFSRMSEENTKSREQLTEKSVR